MDSLNKYSGIPIPPPTGADTHIPKGRQKEESRSGLILRDIGGTLWESCTTHIFVIFGNDSDTNSTGAVDRDQLPPSPMEVHHTLMQKPFSNFKQVPAAER